MERLLARSPRPGIIDLMRWPHSINLSSKDSSTTFSGANTGSLLPPPSAGRRSLGWARFWFRFSAHSSLPAVGLRAIRVLGSSAGRSAVRLEDRSSYRFWAQNEWRGVEVRTRQCARAAVRPSTPSRTERREELGPNPDRETADAERQ